MKEKIPVFLILILAFILRFYKLGQVPVALEWDEAAIGYDAYSLFHTGRDQFGKLLPLTFRSLDDYKPPIYEYLTVPAVAFFGLNEFAVRLPSALSGVLAVYLAYLFGLTFCGNIPGFSRYRRLCGLLSGFFLAVSPWHLQFSRAAFEVNVSVAITLLAVILFLKGLENKKLFLLSGLFFGLNLFSYHSTRVVSPLLLAALFILFNKCLPDKKTIITFFIVLSFFIAGFLPILLSSDAQIRFKATNIFDPGARYLNEKDLKKLFLDRRLFDAKYGYDLAGRIYHNSRLIFLDYDTLKKAFGNYLSNFGFEYLFVRGDAPLHHAPGFGLLYIAEFPLILAGIVFLVFFSKGRYRLIPLIWLLIAPIPNAVTREAPHAVRTELMLPCYQMLAAFGSVFILSFIRGESGWVKTFLVSAFTLLFAFNMSFYLHQYYVHTNLELSDRWFYGRKEAVLYTEKEKGNYDKILVSMHVDMPHIFWLFYSAYPPAKYLAEGGTVSGGFADERNKFDKYEFRNFNYRDLPKDKKYLLVGLPSDFPADSLKLKSVNYLDGREGLIIARNKREND